MARILADLRIEKSEYVHKIVVENRRAISLNMPTYSLETINFIYWMIQTKSLSLIITW